MPPTQEQQNLTLPSIPVQPAYVPKNSGKLIKAIRILLLVLIVIGIGLIATEKFWVPTMVDLILQNKNPVTSKQPSQIDWQSIVGQQPTTFNDGTPYQLYKIGIFTSGEFTGDSLMLIAENNYYTMTESSALPQGANKIHPSAYGYYVADTRNNPIAKWPSDISWFSSGETFPDELYKTQILATSTFPAELVMPNGYDSKTATEVVKDSKGAAISVSNYLYIPNNAVGSQTARALVRGNNVVKISASDASKLEYSEVNQYQYFLQTPFGALFPVEPTAPFFSVLPIDIDRLNMSVGGAVSVNWVTGNATSTYRYLEANIYDTMNGLGTTSLDESQLIQMATTTVGPVYELNPASNSKILKKLYAEVQSCGSAYPDYVPLTFTEFEKTHPIFFWKHPYGDWLVFTREDTSCLPGKNE